MPEVWGPLKEKKKKNHRVSKKCQGFLLCNFSHGKTSFERTRQQPPAAGEPTSEPRREFRQKFLFNDVCPVFHTVK